MRAVHRRVPILSAASLFVLFVSVEGLAQGQQSCSVTVALRVPTGKDISGKLTRMFNCIDRDTKLSRKAAQIIDRQEGTHQNQADGVALCLPRQRLACSPRAYAELFDRSEGTKK
jgi:hypothetical protein